MLRHDIMNRMNTQDRITPSPSAGPLQGQVHSHFDNDAVSVCPTSDGVSIFRCNICGKSYGTWGQVQMHLESHRVAKRPELKSTISTEPNCSFGMSNTQHFTRPSSVCTDEQKVMEGMSSADKMADCSFEACQSNPGFPRVSSSADDTQSSNSISAAKPQLQANQMDKGEGVFANRQNKPGENTLPGDPLTLYICNLCGTSFETKHRLDNHLAEHHRDKNGKKNVDDYSFGCNLCSKSFTAQELFDEHMNSHRRDRVASYMTYTAYADLPYTCNICREGFEILDDLRNHIDVHTSVHSLNNISGSGSDGSGSGGVKNKCFTCQICEKSCSSWDQLKSHVTKHESVVMGGQDSGEGKQFQCDKCKKSFNVWGHLKAHLMRHQNEALSKNYTPSTHGGMVFTCEVCKKVFVAKSHLLGHMKTHTDPVACDVCGKLFQTQQHVNRHKVMHTGERPHKCDVCGMRFMRKEHCKRHILTHISDKSLLATCEICDKSFSRPEHLQRHYRMHTGEKPFKCDICVKEYSRKDRLQHHMKSHEREVRQVLSESSESISDSVDYNFQRFSAQNLSGVESSSAGDSATGGTRTSISTHQRMQNVQAKTSTARNMNVFDPCKSQSMVTSATVLSSVGLVSSTAGSKSRLPDDGGSGSKPGQMSATQTQSKQDQHDGTFTQSSGSFRENNSAPILSTPNISGSLQSSDHTIHRMFSDPSGQENAIHTQKSLGCYIPSCLPLAVDSMSHCKPLYVPHLSDFAAGMGQRVQPCSTAIPGISRTIAHCPTTFAQSSIHSQPVHSDQYESKPRVNVMGQQCVDNSSQGVQASLSNPQTGDSQK